MPVKLQKQQPWATNSFASLFGTNYFKIIVRRAFNPYGNMFSCNFNIKTTRNPKQSNKF